MVLPDTTDVSACMQYANSTLHKGTAHCIMKSLSPKLRPVFEDVTHFMPIIVGLDLQLGQAGKS